MKKKSTITMIIAAVVVGLVVLGVVAFPDIGNYFQGRSTMKLFEMDRGAGDDVDLGEGMDILIVTKALFPGTIITVDENIKLENVGDLQKLIRENRDIVIEYFSELPEEEIDLLYESTEKIISEFDKAFSDDEPLTIEKLNDIKNFYNITLSQVLSKDAKEVYQVIVNNSFALEKFAFDEKGRLESVKLGNISTGVDAEILTSDQVTYNTVENLYNSIKGELFAVEANEVIFNYQYENAQIRVDQGFTADAYLDLSNREIESGLILNKTQYDKYADAFTKIESVNKVDEMRMLDIEDTGRVDKIRGLDMEIR